MTLGWDNPTAPPTTTILLRHGDTRLSPEHRFSGLRDEPLSADGTRQARAAACRLATGAPIDAVLSSPLKRAVATAAIAAGELITPIKILLGQAFGAPVGTPYRLYLGSACINEIQWFGRGFAAVHRVNDTSHLP